jgi:alkyl sulfatase BDS1-like metallo-beta-lactamase superfamily hydrolase
LFKVAEGVYQIRGFAPASMTIVEGATGLIVIDTRTTPGAAGRRKTHSTEYPSSARESQVTVTIS